MYGTNSNEFEEYPYIGGQIIMLLYFLFKNSINPLRTEILPLLVEVFSFNRGEAHSTKSSCSMIKVDICFSQHNLSNCRRIAAAFLKYKPAERFNETYSLISGAKMLL